MPLKAVLDFQNELTLISWDFQMSLVENSAPSLENQRQTAGGLLSGWSVHVFAITILTFGNELLDVSGFSYLRLIPVMLLLSQVGLLGIWGGLGTNYWPWRLLGVCAAMTYLSVLTATSYFSHFWIDGWLEIVSGVITIVVAPTVLVAVVLLIARRTFVQLCCDGGDTIVENVVQLQFSIRHMMLLTLFVGIATPVGMEVRRYLEFSHSGLVTNGVINTIALLTLWAAFGKRFIYIRCLIALGIAALIGFVFDYSDGLRHFPYATAQVVSMPCFFAHITIDRPQLRISASEALAPYKSGIIFVVKEPTSEIPRRWHDGHFFLGRRRLVLHFVGRLHCQALLLATV